MRVASLVGVISFIASITWWLKTMSNSSSGGSDTLCGTLGTLHACSPHADKTLIALKINKSER